MSRIRGEHRRPLGDRLRLRVFVVMVVVGAAALVFANAGPGHVADVAVLEQLDPHPFTEATGQGKTAGVYGARTRNLRRDRAAL